MEIPEKYCLIFILSVLLLSIGGCLSSAGQDSNKIFLTGVNLLYGKITISELFDEFPVWMDQYNEYEPGPALNDSLARADIKCKIEIFLGTWCGDSRREVPRFIKIVDKSGFVTRSDLTLWAVDRNKELDNGLTAQKRIKRVPTFIFYMDDIEIGRIVETPQMASLEEDIFNLIRGKNYSREQSLLR